MQIFSIPPINNKPTSQKKTLSFKGLDQFTQVKQIPDLICACCGKKLLNVDKYVRSITPLSKPLSHAMRKGKFNYLKNILPASWNLLRHFSYTYPKKSLDEIIEKRADYTALKVTVAESMDDSSLTNNTPERHILDKKISSTFFKILENGRTFMKEASFVMNLLSPLKSILTGYKKEVFEILENYARIYPDKTISEIVQETHEIHERKSNQFEEENNKLIKERLENIKLLAKENPDLYEKFNNAEPEILDIIYSNYSLPTRNQKIKRIYNRILNKSGQSRLFYPIYREIYQLPESIVNADSFLTNAYRRKHSDIKIIANLFIGFISSEELIVGFEENGLNKIGNKIVLCNSCIKDRKGIPYDFFIKIHPEMITNMQKQMDIITNEIIKKRLVGNFRFYPLIIARKFKEISNNTINLDIVAYVKEMQKDSKKVVKELQEEIKRIEDDQNDKFLLLDKFPKIRAEIVSRIEVLNSKKQKLQDQISTEKNLQAKIQDYLREWKSKK